MITLHAERPTSRYVLMLICVLVLFCIKLVLSASLLWMIKLFLVVIITSVFLLQCVATFNKTTFAQYSFFNHGLDTASLQFTHATSYWMASFENEAPYQVTLETISYYGLAIVLYFHNNDNKKVPYVIWKDTVSKHDWHQLMVLRRVHAS